MPKKNGRPLIQIDWDKFDKLCAIHCTLEEIAFIFDCSPDTIERAVKREKDMGFADYIKKASAAGKMSLRRKQFEIALSGNVAMLIWLGKQWLGQKEKTEVSTEDNKPIRLAYAIK